MAQLTLYHVIAPQTRLHYPLEENGKRSDRNAIKGAVLNRLTNPKSLHFISQSIDLTAGPVWLQLHVLCSIQKLAGILCLGSVTIASETFGKWFGKHFFFISFTGIVIRGLGIRRFFGGSDVIPNLGNNFHLPMYLCPLSAHSGLNQLQYFTTCSHFDAAR
ncbi:hypothetical protein [Pantoea ananatis]|uniref:hypothetical protein n=1 Tax=Pantoea ananas TaxID=553 RepID=UPI001B3169BE|nr:hypothetical protein [Pantoea ananatis]